MSELPVKQRIIEKLDGMGQETLALLERFIDNLDSYLQSQRSNEPKILVDDVQRRLFIRSLKGKYAHAATSSDAFASRKQEEIDWENRHNEGHF